MAQGKTNAETGIILNTSAGTIHKHLEHIFDKLGVETRTAAAARAMEAMRTELLNLELERMKRIRSSLGRD